jgi:hypothetical protein
VMNNPLNLTDPSGYRWSFKKIFRAAVAIAVAVYAPQFLGNIGFTGAVSAATGLSTAVVNGAAAGFLSGAVSSGNLSGALQGGLTGGLFGAASGFGAADSAARYAVHAVAGCVSSAVGGGGCGAGAASALLGKFTTNATEGWGPGIAQGAATAIAGGVGSVIAGGKFENGAATAAFGYLFNALSEWQMAERASVRALRDHGWQVLEQVALSVSDGAGKSFTVIADSIALKGDTLLITEVKDGLFAKLSPGQKAMFEVAMKGGDISIVSSNKAAEFGLKAGESLFSQAGTVAKLAIQLEANTGSRAAGQLVRALGSQGGAVGVLRVLGSVGFGIARFTSGAQ